MPTLTLHRFTPADTAAVERLLKQTHIDLVLNSAAFRQGCWLATTASHELVGLSHVALTDKPNLVDGWLQHAVHPAWWGRGISQRLIAKNWADLPQLVEADFASNATQAELVEADFAPNATQAELAQIDVTPNATQTEPLKADFASNATQTEPLKADFAPNATQTELVEAEFASNATQAELAEADFAPNRTQAELVEADFDPLNRRPKPLRLQAWTSHETPPEYEAILRKLGLSPYHVYHEMGRSLEPLPPRPASAANVVIKPWRDEHCGAAAQLRNQAFAQSWGYQPTSGAALQRRFRTGRYPAELSYTAWQGECMVGLVHGCWLVEQSQAELVWIAVAPHCRAQGVGRLLMLALMARVRQAGATRITLSNDSAADDLQIGFFQTLGFQITQTVTDYQATFQTVSAPPELMGMNHEGIEEHEVRFISSSCSS